MTCEPISSGSTLRDRKEEATDSSNSTAGLVASLRELREDRTALVARARRLVETGELLTPNAARETARAILGLK